MNVIHLLNNVPWAIFAGWIAANGIPYLSALATKAPSWATGAITAVLSTATGFFSTWAAQGDGFNVKAALGASAIAFVTAFVHHLAFLSGTTLQTQLHAVGTGKHPAK